MSYTSKTNPPPMGLPLARPDKVFCSGQSCPRYGPNEEMLGVPQPTDLIRPLLPISRNETYLISTGALIQRWHGASSHSGVPYPSNLPLNSSNPDPGLVSYLPPLSALQQWLLWAKTGPLLPLPQKQKSV